jgi:hypothetical protein
VLLHTDVVAGLIAGLELPTRLRDVGVELEQLGLIAENPMDVPLGSHQSAQDQGADGHSNVTRRGLVTRARSDAPAGTINGTRFGPPLQFKRRLGAVLASMDAANLDTPPPQRYLDCGRGRLCLRVEPALLDR